MAPLSLTAPAGSFSVHCELSTGPVELTFTQSWSPLGYDRIYELFADDFFSDNMYFYRTVKDFLTQFGVSNDRSKAAKWSNKSILDDPHPDVKFERGMISFAGSGPNSRSADLFIAYNGGHFGKSPWETPIGRVSKGMENIEKLYSYGDMPPWGKGPDQGKLRNRGRPYMEESFSKADYIKSCSISPSEHQILGGLGLPATSASTVSGGGSAEPFAASLPSFLKFAALAVMLVSLWGLIRLSLSRGPRSSKRGSGGRREGEAEDESDKLI